MENTEQLLEIINLLGDIKTIIIYFIASEIACFTVLLIAIYAKGWKA